jgi:cell division protein FtsN
MDPKTDLLVFSKKEIAIIIILLVLVAAFSFTLGLKLGKSLGVAKETPVEHVPLQQKVEKAPEPKHAEEEGVALKPAVKTPEPEEVAEKKADSELASEVGKTKAGISKPVPMSYPTEKKSSTAEGDHFTLQVGSHRTVAEAAEQVSGLKRQNLDAFYLEARVPGKGTWYRVGIGNFPTKEAAEQTAIKWKEAKSLPPYIVQKISE